MTEVIDPFREPAARLARAVAGDDDLRFALVFQAVVDQVVGFAEADDLVEVATEALNGDSDTRSASSSSPVDGLYADSTFLANARAMAEDHRRVVGGAPTSDFPDCVAVGSADGWCCSGTLIAPDVVLTAAHCVDPEGCGQRVHIGDDVRYADTDTIVKVRKAVIHPGYRGPGSPDDLAVLRLARSADVAPRALAPADALEDRTFVRVVGFGRTDFAGRVGYGRRRQVDVPLAGRDVDYGADLDTEFVAATPSRNRDSCRGDSGGPAYVRIGDRWLLAGATSRATKSRRRKCGDGGIYTRVTSHERWIRSVAGR
ncbi:trypsin [Saccharothrix carnea]|uniref:Trypsin n=1 Tax=Saccharothrix carnea TaxID=1280637 RepID=A0A2P8HZV3_SACCR|nr:serine protease [Saccharothrix carnea]PSL51721.1 trypsin [Saccharothrix carnea]